MGAHDEKIANSRFGRRLWKAIEKTGDDAMNNTEWAAGFNQDGYGEWIKNEDARRLFEDVYAIKEALKKLVESKMAAKNGELGMATFDDEHFKNIVAMLFKDMGVENWDQLELKLQKIGMEIAGKMMKCKKLQKLFHHVERLIDIAEREREIFDFGKWSDWEEWWNKNNFQPWM